MMNDESEILRIHTVWIGFEESGKWKDILALCSKDVVWLVPGLGMLQGIDEIGAFLNSQPEITIVSIDTTGIEVEVSNRLAVKRAFFCTTFMEKGDELKIRGAHIWTLRKNGGSNKWEVTSVAWSIEE